MRSLEAGPAISAFVEFNAEESIFYTFIGLSEFSAAVLTSNHEAHLRAFVMYRFIIIYQYLLSHQYNHNCTLRLRGYRNLRSYGFIYNLGDCPCACAVKVFSVIEILGVIRQR